MPTSQGGPTNGLALALFTSVAALLVPDPARAVDGLIELNQTCAVETGCATGDTPGFPITLIARGSYRLTSDLALSDPNTNGIELGADDITIDFNGFTLAGPAFVPITTHACSVPGTGVGISALGAVSPAGFGAQNGRIRGMSGGGIFLQAANIRIERMIAERNCENGIWLGTAALVVDSQARANQGYGIYVGTGSRVRDSISDNNRFGFRAEQGGVLTGCIASTNIQDGFRLGIDPFEYGSLAYGNSAIGNGDAGFRVAEGGLLLNNIMTANQLAGIWESSRAYFGLNVLVETASNAWYVAQDIACNIVNGAKHCP